MEIHEDRLLQLGVELIVVFGSHARGKARADSDLDVGVLFSAGRCELDLLEEVREALGGGDDLDLVCLNRAGSLLLKEAAQDGIVQFESRPGAVEEFRLRAYKRYMDTAKFRRLEAEALDERYG